MEQGWNKDGTDGTDGKQMEQGWNRWKTDGTDGQQMDNRWTTDGQQMDSRWKTATGVVLDCVKYRYTRHKLLTGTRAVGTSTIGRLPTVRLNQTGT